MTDPGVTSSTRQNRPRLSWSDGAGSHTFELSETRTVGSAPLCDIVIADRAVSRLHAELAPREDGLWVRDLESRNGTYLGGIKVIEARVPNAMNLRFGTTEVNVTYSSVDVQSNVWSHNEFKSLIGHSTIMREIFARLARLAETDTPVLILGEPGSGKQAVARALHEASQRAGAPLVTLDCAALPEPVRAGAIIEAALEQAEGGALLLVEPYELPLSLQRELVPPLEANAFRVITTSTQDLRPMVNQGAFREALYFRLAGATVVVPPLRQRAADLKPLLEHFLGDRAALISARLMEDLSRLAWPGNVRELRLQAERLYRNGGRMSEMPDASPDAADPNVFGARTTEVDLRTLDPDALGIPPPVGEGSTMPRLPTGFEPWFESGFKEFRERWIENGEREYLRRLMLRTQRSSSAASREAGLERTYLYRLLKKHGV